MTTLCDMTGQRYGRLLVLMRDANQLGHHTTWLCQCSCGRFKTVTSARLRNGQTRSCGCWNREATSKRRYVHGMSKTPLYDVWRNMCQRCENPQNNRWNSYGGRGISVCSEWRNSVKAFLDWALANGYRRGLTIDRVNNDGNYEPDNCRFVTDAENRRNRG
jgi:hypothetical protein